MPIKTKTFNLTVKEFRRILNIDHLKRIRFVLILFSALALVNLLLALIAGEFPWVVILCLLFIAYYVSLPFIVSMKRQQQLNFINRYCEFDESFFTVFYGDGSIVKLKYEHFVKVIKCSEYYFLYTSLAQFHYLPISAFETEKDIHRFDLLLEGKQLLKLW